jgi:hypothetical protein
VHRNDLGLRKSVRGLDGIFHVHGEMKGALLGGAHEQQHDAEAEAARQLGDAIEPERVAGDIIVGPSSKLSRKPTTSPDKGSMPAGPCRAGVAVTHSAHAARPTALPPSRCALATVVKTCPG